MWSGYLNEGVVLITMMLPKEKCVESCVIMTIVTFQLESLDVRCDGGLEGPEGRLLEVFADELTK